MEEVVDLSVTQRRFQLTLMVGFAASALLVTSLGIYGVVSYSVARRRNEIGIRMALGARARLMTTLFYGFRPDYIPAAAVVSLILLAVAALACFVPARRASRIDPMIALRHE
jgi:ABC-type antimicrobial peptide transport system permease subunit